jgi:hypothetical protein
MIIKRTTAEKMLEYFDFNDKNSILGMKEIPPGYYQKLDSLYVTIKQLNEKGKPGSLTSK